MTPKEKAKELVQKMRVHSPVWEIEGDAKQCALIAVDECLESTKQFIHYYTKEDDKRYADVYLVMCLSVEYWNEVKQEIKKL